ncbi:hypothetical protein IJ843_07525 [bacterium]|nr:hypothetical protein [bacterium]
MFQSEALQTNLRRLMNFIAYTRNYFVKKNPIQAMANDMVAALKDALTVRKKLKMAQYRVNYHRYQLNRMESLIAENNQHNFLKGKNFDQTR